MDDPRTHTKMIPSCVFVDHLVSCDILCVQTHGELSVGTKAITRLMTAEELLRLTGDGQRYELVRGELITMAPAGGDHGYIALNIGGIVREYVRTHGLGRVYAAETGFRLQRNPDTVRAPDAAFVRAERVRPSPGYIDGAPDLAVEVVSPNDTYTEVSMKVAEWFSAGALLIWIIDPSGNTVAVHLPDGTSTMLHESDMLDGGAVLPGLSVLVADIFS